jgi:hypothetical protein
MSRLVAQGAVMVIPGSSQITWSHRVAHQTEPGSGCGSCDPITRCATHVRQLMCDGYRSLPIGGHRAGHESRAVGDGAVGPSGGGSGVVPYLVALVIVS